MAEPRYLYEDVAAVPAYVATAQAILKGAPVGMVSGGPDLATPASSFTWDTNLATTQPEFAVIFLGIALQTKLANVARIFGNSRDNAIMVATGGVWEFDCSSTTFEIGQFVGPAKDTGNNMADLTVAKVASEQLAIGQVIERGTSITRVKFRILSRFGRKATQGA